jgi:hypothetical protein
MITFLDLIKYLGLAVIVYLLIKAFVGSKISNEAILILTIIIMAIAIFLMNQCAACPNRYVTEGYRVTDPPIVDSIYPGPDQSDSDLGNPENPMLIKYTDKDVQDFKDIMGIDKKTYEQIVKNEQKAEKKIRSKWGNEMVFTNTHPFNTVPLGTQLYGYTYLPPENWFRAYERPPVCVTDKRCPVCPIADSGTADLLEFDTSNNAVAPEGINLRYIKRVLNRDK